MEDETHDIKKEVNLYYKVFGTLIAMSVLTVAVSYINFGVAVAITVALVIATFKGSLVASFFMHLAHERKVVYYILLMTISFFACMMILILATKHNPIFGTIDLNKTHIPLVKDSPDKHDNGGHH